MKEEPYRRRCPRAGEASMRAKYSEAVGFRAGNKTPRALAWTDPERACSLCALLSAQLAQLVEQRTENPRVPGSIPGLGTRLTKDDGGLRLRAADRGRLSRLPAPRSLYTVCTVRLRLPGTARRLATARLGLGTLALGDGLDDLDRPPHGVQVELTVDALNHPGRRVP